MLNSQAVSCANSLAATRLISASCTTERSTPAVEAGNPVRWRESSQPRIQRNRPRCIGRSTGGEEHFDPQFAAAVISYASVKVITPSRRQALLLIQPVRHKAAATRRRCRSRRLPHGPIRSNGNTAGRVDPRKHRRSERGRIGGGPDAAPPQRVGRAFAVAVPIGESEAPQVVEAAIRGDFRNIRAGRCPDQFASGLLEPYAPQEFERRASDEAPEVLFQCPSRHTGQVREFADLPGVSGVAPEEVDCFLRHGEEADGRTWLTSPAIKITAVIAARRLNLRSAAKFGAQFG